MDILQLLERMLAETPEYQYLAPVMSRKQLLATIAEIRRLRRVVAVLATEEKASAQPTEPCANL